MFRLWIANHRMRQLAVGVATLTSLAIVAASASVVMLRATPARAGGRPVAPDSVALTGRLDKYDYKLEDSRTVLITATGTGLTYLVKDDQTALAGATVSFEVPKLGLSGTMSPREPGQYAYTIQEQVRIRSPLPFLETLNWQVRDLKIEIDGQDETQRLTLQEKTASALNFHRKDVTGAGLAVFEQPKAYSITNHTRVSFRVVKADGQPAANLSATIELPARGYTETISTDAQGWVRIDRTDELKLSVQGGKMVEIQGPIFIELPDDPDTLFWWEDPTERCEMEFRPSQKRLSAQPGQTAQFGFEVVNRGNRPDSYEITVAGVPESWVEIEYGGTLVDMLPFFGQVVYVNVTPERSAGTKVGTHTITATAKSSCQELTAKSNLKVLEFHQADVDIYGSTMSPGPKLASDLRKELLDARKDAEVSVIVRSDGTLPTGARLDVEAVGGKVTTEFSLIHGMAVRIQADKVDELANLGWVSRVDRNKTVKAVLDHSVPAAGAPALWNLGYDGTGVKVAVIDTGVDYTHPALQGHVILGPDFIKIVGFKVPMMCVQRALEKVDHDGCSSFMIRRMNQLAYRMV